MLQTIPYVGEISACLAAILWAFAVILFKKSGETVHPIALNLFKSILAMLLFLPTMILMHEPLFREAPFREYLLLILSGTLGIGIADTMFFKSLNLLGAGMSAIVECFYSPFIIIPSIIWLGEKLTFVQIIGTLCIISAIFTTTTEKGRGKLSRHNLIWGIFWGISSLACIALAIVSVKPLLERSPLLWVTEIRLFGGVLALIGIYCFHPGRTFISRSFTTIHNWKFTLSGSCIGSYVAMLFWIAGMKFTQASVAATLNQTSNIFIFIFAAWFLKEAMNTQRIVAILMGMAGSILVIFG